jgi:SAM-dependent methyltransferase
MKKTTVFEIYGIDEQTRELILKICTDPHGSPCKKVFLTNLDKGLSGSKVMLAQWDISGTLSKFHVFKIGKASKLQDEFNAINNVAAPLIKGLPHAKIEYSNDSKIAILSQEFIGDNNGENLSLKQFIENCDGHVTVSEMIERLYKEELIQWHPNTKKERKIRTKLGVELQRWLRKGNLLKGAEQIGIDSLQESLLSKFNVSLYGIDHLISLIANEDLTIKKGPVHGDLHAQNIILDTENKLSLIDFGWTGIRWRAIDFIWLECSLKFVVCTPYAKLEDLIHLEDLLDEHWGREDEINYDEILKLIHGNDLAKIVSGIAVIRMNAQKMKVIKNIKEYKKGLAMMAYSLTTFPKLNRVFLFHSIVNNLIDVVNVEVEMSAPYDKLYLNKEILWPEKPGRMVVKALEHASGGKRCLDIGCGDGKNLIYLENNGWTVDGVDKSKLALAGAEKRFGKNNFIKKGNLILKDVVSYEYTKNFYDLVVCYGLYHCLNDEELKVTHKKMVSSLKKGGLIAFATLNDNLPIPDDHHTGKIYLRKENHIFEFIGDSFELLEREIDIIQEDHLPLVGIHKHSLTWALFKKIRD